MRIGGPHRPPVLHKRGDVSWSGGIAFGPVGRRTPNLKLKLIMFPGASGEVLAAVSFFWPGGQFSGMGSVFCLRGLLSGYGERFPARGYRQTSRLGGNFLITIYNINLYTGTF